MLVLELGYEAAAIKLGIKAATLRQWAVRGKWNKTRTVTQPVTTVTALPGQVLTDELTAARRQSTLGLARFSARAAQAAAEHPKPLEIARKARDAAAVHSALWPEVQRQEILSLELLSGRIEIKDVDKDGDKSAG